MESPLPSLSLHILFRSTPWSTVRVRSFPTAKPACSLTLSCVRVPSLRSAPLCLSAPQPPPACLLCRQLAPCAAQPCFAATAWSCLLRVEPQPLPSAVPCRPAARCKRQVAVEVPRPPTAPCNTWPEATSRLESDPKEEDGNFWIRSLEKRIILLERFESCEFCRKALKSFRFSRSNPSCGFCV
jgi:hypothetical protein